MADSKAIEKDFKFSIPIQILKSRKEGEWRIGGIATDQESPDLQGEEVLVDGLNVEYLTQRGSFNWDHGKGPEDIVGEIDVAKKIEQNKKLYVEGFLYPEVDRAKAVYKLLRSLKESGSKRKLGLSLEGKIQERDETGKQIKKAWIKNVAVTYHPINQGTWVDFCKSQGIETVEFERTPIGVDIKEPEEDKLQVEEIQQKEPVSSEVKVQEEPLNSEVEKGQKVIDVKEKNLEEEPNPDSHKEIGLEKADPVGPSPASVGMKAGYERDPAKMKGGEVLKKESLDKKKKVVTYDIKDVDGKEKEENDKQVKDAKAVYRKKKMMKKSDVIKLFVDKGYDAEMASKLTDAIFMRNSLVNLIKSSDKVAEALADLLIKAAQIKGYIRSRRGKLERVSPYTREIAHEMFRIKTMSAGALMTRAMKITDAAKLLHFYTAAVNSGRGDLAAFIKKQGPRLGLTNNDFSQVHGIAPRDVESYMFEKEVAEHEAMRKTPIKWQSKTDERLWS